jgi:hypothetical protein
VFQFIEVDDQTQGDIKQLHGAQQVRIVDGMNFMNSFDLDKQAPLDQQNSLLSPFPSVHSIPANSPIGS